MEPAFYLNKDYLIDSKQNIPDEKTPFLDTFHAVKIRAIPRKQEIEPLN